jgi:hypothetical protein
VSQIVPVVRFVEVFYHECLQCGIYRSPLQQVSKSVPVISEQAGHRIRNSLGDSTVIAALKLLVKLRNVLPTVEVVRYYFGRVTIPLCALSPIGILAI